jgi:hypothetical protein
MKKTYYQLDILSANCNWLETTYLHTEICFYTNLIIRFSYNLFTKTRAIFYFCICCFAFFKINTVAAQTTYTWNVANGNFLAPNSWTPARNTPDTNDVLVFDGNTQATTTVNNLRTQTIGRLLIINNANVNFATAIADTGIGKYEFSIFSKGGLGTQFLTQLKVDDIISDSLYNTSNSVGVIENDSLIFLNTVFYDDNFVLNTNYVSFFVQPKLIIKQKHATIPSFEISQNSKLQINCNAPSLTILIDSGAFAKISGIFDIAPLAARLTSSAILTFDSNAIQIKSTGKITSFEKQRLDIFGLIKKSAAAIFDSGTAYETREYTFTGGYYNPVKFLSGSTFIFDGFKSIFSNIGYSNINFGNFVYKNYITNTDFKLRFYNCNIENLQIDSGNVQIEIMDELIVKKNITIKPFASLSIQSANGLNKKFTFKGTNLQEINGEGTLQFNGDKFNTLNIILNNNFGLKLRNNIQIVNCNLKLDSGALNLNGNNITIGKDSNNLGSITSKDGYIFGNGKLTKWYPSNKLVTGYLDSTYFPFGTSIGKRTFWVTGNVTKSGTISITHVNNPGMLNIASSFTDNSITVNKRQKYSWQVETGNGLRGSNFTIKATGNIDSGYNNLPTNCRLTLANSKAPGLGVNGTGTALLPLVTRTNLNDSNLNNTYYLGAYSTLCSPPFAPIITSETICNNNKAILTTAGDGTISWYSDSIGGSYLSSDNSFETPKLLNSTVYYVQDSTCSASSRAKVWVNVITKPLVGFTINNSLQCINNNSFEFNDTTSLNNSYNRFWKFSNGDSTTNKSFSKTFNAIGTFSVKLLITNINNNSCKDSITKTIDIYPKPLIKIIARDSEICEGKTVLLRGFGAKTYSWNNNIFDNISFKPVITKNYLLIGIDSNNCADSANYIVKVNSKPKVLVSVTNSKVCEKTPITLTATGAKFYYWSDSIINNISFIPKLTKTYLLNAIDTNGCSDTATINIVVKPLPNTITAKNKTTITATQTGATYQWLNCNTAKSIIAGAINQSYTATVNGNYAVIVTQNGCSDTSVCVNINSVGLSENKNENKISIFPNPATTKLTITSETAIKEIYIYDVLGKLVKQVNLENTNTKSNEIAIDELSEGIYIIQVVDVFDAKLSNKFIKE